jgi:zinc D-Ala-D-Ala carboxypeptidase
VITEAQGAVLPLVPYLDALRWVFIVLALAGIGVAVWAQVDDWRRGRR